MDSDKCLHYSGKFKKKSSIKQFNVCVQQYSFNTDTERKKPSPTVTREAWEAMLGKMKLGKSSGAKSGCYILHLE